MSSTIMSESSPLTPTLPTLHNNSIVDIQPKSNSLESNKHKLLNESQATAICGNDITSSCLYVAAIATVQAGFLAPVVLLMVSLVLYWFRKIYTEVGEALPLNGGAYNCLLNTTTKAKASIAACLTILSYMATAVISAKTSVEYLNFIIQGIPILPVTVIVLGIFAFLVILGIGESAKVAQCIFFLHMTVLFILCIFGLFFISSDTSIIKQNWGKIPLGTNYYEAVFFGFSVAILGVSGFESSANYIEEQQDNVFPKTLRNMWLAVTIFNPLIAFIALGVLGITEIAGSYNYLLAEVAQRVAGPWAGALVSLNAMFVLSGAVLASFVGVTGLISRMSLDRCLPQFLTKTNKRGSYQRITLLFLAICISILFITSGNLSILAGVYTIAFLGVMSLFAIGNLLLKTRRSRIPRNTQASWISVLLALIATVSGIYGNIKLKPVNLQYFSLYFIPTATIVMITLYRKHILELLLLLVNEMMNRFSSFHNYLKEKVNDKIQSIRSEGIIFFTKGDDVANLNRAMLYVQQNESTNSITIIHILDSREYPPKRLISDVKLLDEIYPELNIKLEIKRGTFGPQLIQKFSKDYGVPSNYMFLGTPGPHFPYRIRELAGVRYII